MPPSNRGSARDALSSTDRIAPPEELDRQGYPDLTGLIKPEENKFPAHFGGYSDVYIGHLIEDPTYKVAIKVLRVSNERNKVMIIRKQLSREAAVWHRLDHKNVLRFLGLASDLGRFPECPALIAPYCDQGTVMNYLKKHPAMEVRIAMMQGAACGLQYLHEREVVHGDLKPTNVLVTARGIPVLSDFGRSKILTLHGFTTKPVGTCRYQAPELLGGAPTPTKPTDVCAFGLTALEIWSGIRPYDEIEHDGLVVAQVILNEAQPHRPNPLPLMAERIWPILQPCWSTLSRNRPSIQTVVQQIESCTQFSAALPGMGSLSWNTAGRRT